MKMNVNGLDVEGSMFRDMDGKQSQVSAWVKAATSGLRKKDRGSAGLPAV
ncbi:MAG: hypothetical protein ACLRQR_13520 [Merdimonas faecis]